MNYYSRIDLSGTDMESWQGRVDEELRINEKYRGTLRGERKVAGSLILCGYGYAENGIEVLVEYSGDIDYFVDILVRSAKPFAEALKFIHEHVVGKILQFAASPQGCQGVLLLEAVIRPQCVEDLDLCKDRKYHSVLVTALKERVDEDRGFLHIWENLGGNGKHMDLALDLLEGKGPYDSYLAANQVDVDPTEKPRLRDFLALKQELPKLFYPTIDDVRLSPKLNNIKAGGRMKAVKLHLMCEERDCNHSVREQKGRTLELNWNTGGYNLPIMTYAIAVVGLVSVWVQALQVKVLYRLCFHRWIT